MGGSASSRECWKENPYTEDSMKTLLWTTLPWCGVKPNLLIVLWNCLFNVLSTGLCLEAVTWRMVSSSGKSGGPALCAVCCVLCAAPVLCTTRHWANSRCGTSQLKMAQFPKRSAKSELLWRNLYYRCCDEHSGGILCLFCFLCVNLSMILIIEKVIKLFWVFFNFSSHKVKCPIKIFEQKQPGAFFSSPFSLVFNLLGFLAFSWPLWTLFWENGWRTLIFLHILPSRSYTLCSTILTFICKWSMADHQRHSS